MSENNETHGSELDELQRQRDDAERKKSELQRQLDELSKDTASMDEKINEKKLSGMRYAETGDSELDGLLVQLGEAERSEVEYQKRCETMKSQAEAMRKGIEVYIESINKEAEKSGFKGAVDFAENLFEGKHETTINPWTHCGDGVATVRRRTSHASFNPVKSVRVANPVPLQ